jgi:hypothetical protein
MPAELGGHGRPATNPEQLFAAGNAACFTNDCFAPAAPRELRLRPARRSRRASGSAATSATASSRRLRSTSTRPTSRAEWPRRWPAAPTRTSAPIPPRREATSATRAPSCIPSVSHPPPDPEPAMPGVFTFQGSPARIVFGQGSLQRVPEEIDRLAARALSSFRRPASAARRMSLPTPWEKGPPASSPGPPCTRRSR